MRRKKYRNICPHVHKIITIEHNGSNLRPKKTIIVVPSIYLPTETNKFSGQMFTFILLVVYHDEIFWQRLFVRTLSKNFAALRFAATSFFV